MRACPPISGRAVRGIFLLHEPGCLPVVHTTLSPRGPAFFRPPPPCPPPPPPVTPPVPVFVPATHVFPVPSTDRQKGVDGRDKPGHGEIQRCANNGTHLRFLGRPAFPGFRSPLRNACRRSAVPPGSARDANGRGSWRARSARRKRPSYPVLPRHRAGSPSRVSPRLRRRRRSRA